MLQSVLDAIYKSQLADTELRQLDALSAEYNSKRGEAEALRVVRAFAERAYQQAVSATASHGGGQHSSALGEAVTGDGHGATSSFISGGGSSTSSTRSTTPTLSTAPPTFSTLHHRPAAATPIPLPRTIPSSSPPPPPRPPFLLQPPVVTGHSETNAAPVSRVSDERAQPVLTASSDPVDGDADAVQQPRKRRVYRGLKTTAESNHLHVAAQNRRRWLYDGHSRGNKDAPITHHLSLPPFYTDALDAEAVEGQPMRSVPDQWDEKQVTVVQYFTQLLQCHAAKVAISDAATFAQRRGRGRVHPPSSSPVDALAESTPAESVALDSPPHSGNSDTVPSRDAESGSGPTGDEQSLAQQGVSRQRQHNDTKRSRKRKAPADGDSDPETSDWEKDLQVMNARPPSEVAPASHPTLDGRRLMTDELYVLLIEVLLNPQPRLQRLLDEQPEWHKVIDRTLLYRHRYHLFWASVDVEAVAADAGPGGSGRPASGGAKYPRLVPMLYSVSGSCLTDVPQLSSCRRVLPLTQVAILLNRTHCNFGHMRDHYLTFLQTYTCVPRKAVRLFAKLCHGCGRVEQRVRNQKVPQAVVAEDVRQRFVLDLIDLLQWQQSSTGSGHKQRYVAHMVDHSSKRRWVRALANKGAEPVREFVRDIFASYGHPALLHTDNGREFVNNLLEDECRKWGTHIVHGRPYHPQSQGAVERPNGWLQRTMQAYRNEHPLVTDWVDILQTVTQLHNAQVHSVTGLIPERHFHQHNNASRERRPLLPSEPCVLTVDQVNKMEKFRWLTTSGEELDARCVDSTSRRR